MHHVESTGSSARPSRIGVGRRSQGERFGSRRSARLSVAAAAAVAALVVPVGGAAWAASYAPGVLAGPAAPAAPAAPAGPALTTVPLGGFGQWRASLNPGRDIPAADIGSSAIALCAKVATKAGFSFNRTVNTPLGPEPRVAVAIAIAMAESSCTLGATNHDSNGSQDRGLWQINNAAWPNISNACAYQIQCNANAAYTISAYGSSWSPWATFTNGAWQRYIGSAVSAIGSGFTFQLANQGTGTCVAAAGASPTSSSANGAPILLSACDATDNSQQWKVVDVPGHMPILQNVGHGSCLDADGTAKGPGKPIFQWACDGSNASEQWSFNGSGILNNNGNAEAGLQNNADGTCLAAVPSNGTGSGSSSSGTGTGSGTGAGTGVSAGKVVQGNCAAADAFQLWN